MPHSWAARWDTHPLEWGIDIPTASSQHITLKISGIMLYLLTHQNLSARSCWKEGRMRTTCLIEFAKQVHDRGRFREDGQWTIGTISGWCCSACCVALVMLVLVVASPAQVLSAPPRLAPTAEALGQLQKCGSAIAKSAPKISSKIIESENLLSHGLLIGWNNPSGQWAVVPPPKEYVQDLAQEAEWCLKVANALNTQPSNEMGVPPALPGRQSNFENSGSIPPAVAFVFAEARCLASLVPLQLLLLFTGCDQAPLRGQQP